MPYITVYKIFHLQVVDKGHKGNQERERYTIFSTKTDAAAASLPRMSANPSATVGAVKTNSDQEHRLLKGLKSLVLARNLC